MRRLVHALLVMAVAACSRPVPSAAGPHRVVCLTPSSTELVAAIGGQSWIVGVDQFSTFPAGIESLPKVGDFLAPNLDAILALHPDIVVADDVQEKVLRTLNYAGIRTIPLPMQTVADVRNAFATLGRALGVGPGARAALDALDAEIADATRLVQRSLAASGRRVRALFVVDRQPGGLGNLVAAGPGTYVDELLARAGADNVLSDSPVRYPKLSPEEVLARAPEVIFDALHAEHPEDALHDWSPLATVPAVRDGRVYVLADSLFVSPGPRLGQALARLALLLWPAAPR